MAFDDGTDMRLGFLVDGKTMTPPMGILNGYIQEAINEVTAIELFTVSEADYTEEEIESDLLNKNVTITMSTFIEGDEFTSRWDGVIFEVDTPDSIHLGPNVFLYRLTIRPQFWKMAVSNNSVSFPQKNRIQVIDEVLEANKFVKDVSYETQYLSEDVYPTLPQILQCETSDMAFVQRLMREAGINYYFMAPIKPEDDKKGAERLRLVDNAAFFRKVFPHPLMWKPAAGLTNKRRISAFETSLRTVPAEVESTASFGEGSTQTYASAEAPEKGTGGKFRDFSTEGQTDKIARNNAKVLKERFDSRRMSHQGKSNHFMIRAGERFTVTGPRLNKDKEILVTSVRHSFSQTVNAALAKQGGSTPTYTNIFSSVGKETEYRPQEKSTQINTRVDIVRNQILVDLVAKLNVAIKNKLNVDLDLHIDELDLTISPEIDINMYHFEMVNNLIQSVDTAGVHCGTVTGAASVAGGEMTCTVATDHFGTVQAKVSTNWLDSGGGITMFPRVGAQVFLVFLRGNKNDGVVIGYRSTSSMTALDPASSTATEKLKAGSPPTLMSPPSKVVEADSFSPSNYNRLGIRGKGGVAEVAVLDEDASSVTINAQKDIYTVAKAEHHSYSSLFLQMVNGDCNIDIIGNENKGIAAEHKTSVGGNQELTVMGDQTEHIQGNRKIHIIGSNDVKADGNHWFKWGRSKFEVTMGNTNVMNYAIEFKTTVGAFTEYKYAISTGITRGINNSIDHSKKVELLKDKRIIKVLLDDKKTIDGNWITTVKGDRIFTVEGVTQFDFKKQVDIKSGEGLRIEAKDDISLESSSKNVALISKTKTALIKAGKNIDLQSSGGKMKIHASGINYKGNLHQIG